MGDWLRRWWLRLVAAGSVAGFWWGALSLLADAAGRWRLVLVWVGVVCGGGVVVLLAALALVERLDRLRRDVDGLLGEGDPPVWDRAELFPSGGPDGW